MLAQALIPSTDLGEARLLLQETSDAHMLIGRFGSPSFGGMKNVNGSLARAEAGGALSMRELLDIARRRKGGAKGSTF